MEKTGILRKMVSEQESPVKYILPVGENRVEMNALLSKEIRIDFLGQINCIKCGRPTNKSFAQGFCFPCFTTAPETEECVLRPELCQAHLGIARDMAYAADHCLIEQVVYLSITSDLKVGVTRSTQVPTRWIDQGATAAIELARTPNRYTAGLIEVALKAYLKDKTNWQAMLKNQVNFEGDLIKEKERIVKLLPREFSQYASENNLITRIEYPVSQFPDKVKSLNLDKDPIIEGILTGIKGQYLILDNSKVLNVRKFGGYQVKFSY